MDRKSKQMGEMLFMLWKQNKNTPTEQLSIDKFSYYSVLREMMKVYFAFQQYSKMLLFPKKINII